MSGSKPLLVVPLDNVREIERIVIYDRNGDVQWSSVNEWHGDMLGSIAGLPLGKRFRLELSVEDDLGERFNDD